MSIHRDVAPRHVGNSVKAIDKVLSVLISSSNIVAFCWIFFFENFRLNSIRQGKVSVNIVASQSERYRSPYLAGLLGLYCLNPILPRYGYKVLLTAR